MLCLCFIFIYLDFLCFILLETKQTYLIYYIQILNEKNSNKTVIQQIKFLVPFMFFLYFMWNCLLLYVFMTKIYLNMLYNHYK